MSDMPFGTGALPSPYDVRTFAFVPSAAPVKGGVRYLPEDIFHQHKVGTCTATEAVQQASKAMGIKFSDDFQYLAQKREYDSKTNVGWSEGSSNIVACKVQYNIGHLPASAWTHTTEADKSLPYDQYIAKLKAIPDDEYKRLCDIAANYKARAFEQVTDLSRDGLARAIDESKYGIRVRFDIDKQWWTEPVEPLRAPTGESSVSGHAGILCNYEGISFRDANCWGPGWADKGTAYFLYSQYRPTEAWIVYYNEVPQRVQDQLDSLNTAKGKLLTLLQTQLISLLQQYISKLKK